MSPQDQAIADREVPEYKVEKLKTDEMVRRFEERQLFAQQGVQQFPASIHQSFVQWQEAVNRWKTSVKDSEEEAANAMTTFYATVGRNDPVWW